VQTAINMDGRGVVSDNIFWGNVRRNTFEIAAEATLDIDTAISQMKAPFPPSLHSLDSTSHLEPVTHGIPAILYCDSRFTFNLLPGEIFGKLFIFTYPQRKWAEVTFIFTYPQHKWAEVTFNLSAPFSAPEVKLLTLPAVSARSITLCWLFLLCPHLCPHQKSSFKTLPAISIRMAQ
jgi:hypothetical protein